MYGWYEVLFFFVGLALLAGGIKLFKKETSKDGGVWRKVLGGIIFAFGVGTTYGVIKRIFGDVDFLDLADLILAFWNEAVVPLWNTIRGA